MVAVVAIVQSVVVNVPGGESVGIMTVLQGWNVSRCCGRCTFCDRPPPRLEAAAAYAVLTVVVVVPVVVLSLLFL